MATRAPERPGRAAGGPRRPAPHAGPAREAELAALWRRLREDADPDARDRLVLHYAPLAKYVAGRVRSKLPPHVDEADLISCGLIGLMNAIDRFEPDRRVPFETYAVRRIKGAIVDELRARDRLPRSVRAQARQIERAFDRLETRLQRAPSDEEVAADLGIGVLELQDSMDQVASSTFFALDESWTLVTGEAIRMADTVSDHATAGPERAFEAAELRNALADAIARLPERERVVVALYHYDGLTMAEIGEAVGVAESRVSQLHTRAILRLRGRLGRRPS